MKFGITHSSFAFDSDQEKIFDEVAHLAQWAEKKGFAWFSVMDHFIQIEGIGSREDPMLEAWTLLAALAASTKKIRLATLVSSVGYRNPALLAKMAAGVDVISHGRLTLGIGAGWFAEEYQQYGYPFPTQPSVRIKQLEEAIQIIKLMWTDQRATFHGQYFHIQNAILEPKPIQKPHPPILIGGSGRKLTLRIVAKYGDATNVFGDPDSAKEIFDVLRDHCEQVGRNFDEIEKTILTNFLIAKDESLLKMKTSRLGEPGWGHATTLLQAIDLVGRYQDAGVQLLIFDVHKNDEETLGFFAEDVMRHF